MYGFGKLYYPNEELAYEGEWENNAVEGSVTVKNDDPMPLDHTFNYKDFNKLQKHWSVYTGQLEGDSKEGFGIMYLVNDEKYVGQFMKDMMHGKGAFYTTTGGLIQGTWK